MAVRTITILGATGSIGDNTLDLVRAHRDRYRIEVLTAGLNAEKLVTLAHEFRPAYVALADQSSHEFLKENLPTSVKIVDMDEAASIDTDWTMAAIVGTAGLVPTMNAIKRGRTVAFASKECLVAAGDLMMSAVREHGTTFLPIDSEHNAIFQVFNDKHRAGIERLILTASGGPFRTKTWDEMENASPAQAIDHPTWSMGKKISVDSASLMNKALEIIEAHYLFSMPSTQIDVVIHPQSIIHSMVEYVDGSILSQMGPADMRTPIAYCLGWPERMVTSGHRLDMTTVSQLTFEKPDIGKFKSLAMVRDVLDEGQAASIIFNAANEESVAAFLTQRIRFTCIYDMLYSALELVPRPTIAVLDDVLELDWQTRQFVQQTLTNGRKTIYV